MSGTISLMKLKQESYSTFESSTLNGTAFNSNGTSSQNFLPELRVYRNGPGPGKYSRASTVGYRNHDYTLIRSPAYSLGKAKRMENGYKPKSPGPNAYDSARAYCHSSKSLRSPGYYLCGRSLDNFNDSRSYSRRIDGPAPASYAPEKHTNSYKRRVPSYSMSKASRFPDLIA